MHYNKKLTLGILLTFIICIGSAILATYSTGPYGNYPNPGIHPGMIGPGTFNASGAANPQWNFPGPVKVGVYAVKPACNAGLLGAFVFDTIKDRPFICASSGWKPLDSDLDKDGSIGGTGPGFDCNDNNPAIYPGSIENCYNNVDDNCNGLVDGADSDCITCMDSCSPEGSTQCIGNYLQTCGDYDSDGCLEWNTGVLDPACGSNECSPENITQCDGANGVIQQCQDNGAGSLEWVTIQDCSKCTDPTCTCGNYWLASEEGYCHDGKDNDCDSTSANITIDATDPDCSGGVPSSDCTDECAFAGKLSCDGITKQTCGSDYDSDTCLEWGDDTDCDKQCFNPVTTYSSCNNGTCEGIGTNCYYQCYDSTRTKICTDGYGCVGPGYDCTEICFNPTYQYTKCSEGSGCSTPTDCTKQCVNLTHKKINCVDSLGCSGSVACPAGQSCTNGIGCH